MSTSVDDPTRPRFDDPEAMATELVVRRVLRAIDRVIDSLTLMIGIEREQVPIMRIALRLAKREIEREFGLLA